MNHQNVQISHLFQQGLDLINSNKLQEAKELFTKMCEYNPQETEAWYLLSTINGRLGDIDAAGECCRRALDIQPDHYEARVNLGNVLYNQGRLEEAAAQYQISIEINSNNPVVHNNLGNLLSTLDKNEEAATSYQKAIQLNPNLAAAYQNLGNLRLKQALYDKAVNNYSQAIRLNPNDGSLRNSLGIALMNLDRNNDALLCFQQSIQIDPSFVDPHINIGNVYLEQGNYNEALKQFEIALRLAPTLPEIHNNIGTVYFNQGNLDKAISYYQRALEINPLYTVAINNLGKASRFKGQFDLYMNYYRLAVEQLPDAAEVRTAFIENIQNIVPGAYNPWLDDELKKCYSLSGANYSAITLCTSQHLKHKYNIHSSGEYDDDHIRTMLEKFSSDPLFLLFLEKTYISDADLELLLTKVRAVLLLNFCEENTISLADLKVVNALAFQGLNNEYVFASDDVEDSLLSRLRDSIEHLVPTLESPTVELENKLLIFGMYDRIFSLSCKTRLSIMPSSSWSEAFRPLLEQTLTIPFEEERIKQEIISIGNIEDKTSQLVQSQYEENPYPRWLSIPKLKQENINHFIKRLFPHFVPPAFLDEPIQILIAGCGTGRPARTPTPSSRPSVVKCPQSCTRCVRATLFPKWLLMPKCWRLTSAKAA